MMKMSMEKKLIDLLKEEKDKLIKEGLDNIF